MNQRTIGLIVVGLALAGGLLAGLLVGRPSGDAAALAEGRELYVTYCASCHGASLEGQPNWKEPLPDGRLPAPPHDATGHTWHHPDDLLFQITREGGQSVSGSPSGMPAFGAQLSDDQIRAVLAYIKSTWPPDIQATQREITEQNQ